MRQRAIIFLLVSGAAGAQNLPAIRADLERASGQIDVLAPLAIWNDRVELRSQEVTRRLVASGYPSSALRSLLSDSSPRIRTLALELLFNTQDPRLLPDIVERIADTGPTFDTTVEYDFSDNARPKSRRAAQTVGDFARAMADFYGVRGDFPEYWAARKGRNYCFSLSRSRLSRLTGGLPTLNPGVRERLAPFRRALERLPPLDRNLYLIWLQATFTEPALASDADLTDAVRRLGRENVLAIAEGNPPGGDGCAT